MKMTVKKGRTSLLSRVFIQDSASTTGAGKTGLTNASLTCYRARDDDGNAGATAVSLSAGTRGTWSSGGFVEKDATNQPGIYELGLPDAGQATGSETVTYMLKGTGVAPCLLEIQLVAYDPQAADVVLSNAGIDAILDRANGVESGYTLRQALKLMSAVLCGKSSANGTSFRSLDDTKTRVAATTDANANRTAQTYDLT